MTTGKGPLAGLRVVEFQSAGPGPFGCMLLGDMGAEVITVGRPDYARGGGNELDPTLRNRRSILLDLKRPDAVAVALRLIATADVATEGLRPGVMERLGLGPEVLMARNPRLVYVRMTGWGQEGPLSRVAGHDHNYLSIAGALSTFGLKGGPPVPPLNLVGDYGGGGMFMAFSILSALYERARSDKGQVLDVAMVDGISLLMAYVHGMRAAGQWSDARGSNLLDTGAPFARPYKTADGRFLSVCSMEPEFYRNVLRVLRLDDVVDAAAQYDPQSWPATSELFAERFGSESLSSWMEKFDQIDSCVTPVLSLAEAYEHPHALARGAFLPNGEGKQPAPAPRFSRSAPVRPVPPRRPGQDSLAILREMGYTEAEIAPLLEEGAVSAL